VVPTRFRLLWPERRLVYNPIGASQDVYTFETRERGRVERQETWLMRMSQKRPSPKAPWGKKLTTLRALSVRQPWAWLIVNGYKDVENRSWRTHRRGPILIHAALNTRDLRGSEVTKVARRYGIKMPREYEMGGIIGAAEIVDCRASTGSPWHRRGAIGWVMAKPRRLSFRECKGSLGFFRPKFK
jgi:hypothetical protein